MKQSQLFTKTRSEAPADEVTKNAQLLTRAGYIYKEVAGAYVFLPLGLRVLEKIEDIIREEMNRADGQELRMTALQSPDVWQKTDRWSDEVVDVWFKTELHAGGQLGFGLTHEDPITNMMTHNVSSYRDLPAYIYQFQTKFRNELRAKAGILRGREFLMKDLYSFCKNKEEHDQYYEKMKEVYHYTFERLGIGDETFITVSDARPFFDGFAHEFQTLIDAGEDTIYLDREAEIAVNDEIYEGKVYEDFGMTKEEFEQSIGVNPDRYETVKASEVGNIYTLGYKYSEPLGLTYKDEDGKEQHVFMGSYGLGLTRVMGVITELMADEKGLVWPEEIAPYQVHLLALGKDDVLFDQAQTVYEQLQARGTEVLYDDRRDMGAGQKFADADLIGIPWRAVISEKSLEAGGVELKRRDAEGVEIMNIDDFLDRFR